VGRELSTGRKVAVKILLDGQDDQSKERFQQEARFLSRIDHPNVVQIFGYGEETWSAPRAISLSEEEWFKSFSKSAPIKSFIAMEWVEGGTLDEFINPSDEANRVSDKQIAEWFAQATSALSAVHFSGLVHRDLKPSNLMVDDDGEIKLMDFGIARSQDKERTLQTATGGGLGTLAYMSPEQIRAANKEAEVGPPTDIYSLCATFYELFTHRRLFGHDTESLEMITTRKLAGERPERPRLITKGLPWELETILMGGLEAHVEDRYPSMEAVRHDIHRFLNDEPIEYKRPTLKRRLQLGYRRNRLVANLTLFFVVVAMAGSAWYVTKIQLALNAKEVAEQRRIEADELRLQGDINLLLGNTNSARVVLEKFDDLNESDKPLIKMLLDRLQPVLNLGAKDGKRTQAGSSPPLTPHSEIRIRMALLRWRTTLLRTHAKSSIELDQVAQGVIDQSLLTASLLQEDALDDLKNASDLTRVEKSKLQAMLEVLMSAPPAEVVLIRDTVAPQAEAFAGRLWSVLQDSEREIDRRLRAACCLAAWDADNELWPGVMDDVAGFLVEQNPLDIQDWIAAFARQHQQLVPHLKVRFLNRDADHHEQSQLAALILSSLVKHDPQEMADLIVNSNPEQFKMLFAAFVPARANAISSTPSPEISLDTHQQLAQHLREALARGPATVEDLYSPVPSDRPDPDAELRQAVEQGFGLISKRFAFVGQLQSEEFDPLNTRLADCGFRLNRYRRSASHISAVWIRDGREAHVEITSSIKELKDKVESQAEIVDGLRIIDASTFVETTESGRANRYVGLFQRKQPDDAVTRLQLDAGNSKSTALWVDEGFLPLTFQQASGASGLPIRCIVRRQELENYPPWERNAPKNIAKLYQDHNSLNWTGIPAHDISLGPGTPVPNTPPVDACVLWIRRNDVIGNLFYGVLNEQTLQQCRNFEQAGWEVVSISTTPGSNNEQHAVIVWHQRQISAVVNAQVADRRANAAIALLRLSERFPAAVINDLLSKTGSTSEPAADASTPDAPPEDSSSDPELVQDSMKDSAVEAVWQSLAHSRQPSLRSNLIHRFRSHGVSADTVFNRLQTERNAFIIQALVQALGEYAPAKISESVRKKAGAWLLDAYQNHPDAGVHSSVEWAYSRWNADVSELQSINRKLSKKGLEFAKDSQSNRDKFVTEEFKKAANQQRKQQSGFDLLSALGNLIGKTPPDVMSNPPRPLAMRNVGPPKNWYVNPGGHTMVIVDSTQPFLMGAPINVPDWDLSEDLLHWQLIPQSFAIATSEMTHASFQQFQAESEVAKKLFLASRGKIGMTPQMPLANMNFIYAAAYCNWLSQKEGLPKREWCYQVRLDERGVPSSVYVYPDYLLRSGYRMPTEDEWEFACRADTGTTWYFGDNENMLRNYAWYSENSESRFQNVKRLKPNDLGLFDMLGNGAELCDRVIRRNVNAGVVCFQGCFGESDGTKEYALRGGCASGSSPSTRSSGLTPIRYDSKFITLRVARTWQTYHGQIARATEMIGEPNPTTNPILFLRRGMSASRIGDHKQASSDYRQFVSRFPGGFGGLYLTGMGEHVEGPNFDFSSLGPFTIEAIVTDWDQTILSSGSTRGQQANKNAIWFDSISAGWVSKRGLVAGALNIPIQTRNHVALVFDGDNMRTYLNGKLTKALASAPPDKQPAKDKLLIGATPSGSFKASGLIECFRISRGALYTQQQHQMPGAFQADAKTELLYDFRLDFQEQNGLVVKDRSGKGRDAKVIGAWWDNNK
jgi:serine/threonine protein kinase/formylglycine-generating enzyme required for sulfatase activity